MWHVVWHVELDVQQQQQCQYGMTRLFAVCGQKENYLKDQFRLAI